MTISEADLTEVDDRAIRDKLLAELKAQKWAEVSSANITVKDGVVHLWSSYYSDQEKRALVVAAERIPGVRRVEDHMRPRRLISVKRGQDMSLHPITDKAEVSVDFPEKVYIGNFGRHSQFDAYTDADNVAIRLVRLGEDRREAVVHLHYGLLADILTELARSLRGRDPLDDQHRSKLSAAASLESRVAC